MQPSSVNQELVDLEVSLIGALCQFVTTTPQENEQHPVILDVILKCTDGSRFLLRNFLILKIDTFTSTCDNKITNAFKVVFWLSIILEWFLENAFFGAM